MNEENVRITDRMDNLMRYSTELSRMEFQKAVKLISNRKSEDPDKIPMEVWRTLREEGLDLTWDICARVYSRKNL